MFSFLGAYDGIGATLKRGVQQYSLRQPHRNQILNAKDFFTYCDQNIKGVKVFFVPKNDIISRENYLKDRFKKAKIVNGTMGFHSVIWRKENSLSFKTYSKSEKRTTKKIHI